MRLLLTALLVLLVACSHPSKAPTAQPTASAATIGSASTAVDDLSARNKEIEVSTAKREGAIAAYLDVAIEVLSAQTVNLATLRTLINLARSNVNHIGDATKMVAAREIADLQAAGRTKEATAATNILSKDALAAATAEAELKALRAEQESALANRIAALERERLENTKKNQDAINKLHQELIEERENRGRSLRTFTARVLVGIGIAGIIGSGLMIWSLFSVNPLKAFKSAIPLVAGSLLSIGCGLIVNQPWFLWAVGVVVVVLIVGVAGLIIHNHKTQKVLTSTLTKTVQSVEEQSLENAPAAKDLKEYQEANLDTAEKKLIDELLGKIDRTYIEKVIKSKAS